MGTDVMCSTPAATTTSCTPLITAWQGPSARAGGQTGTRKGPEHGRGGCGGGGVWVRVGGQRCTVDTSSAHHRQSKFTARGYGQGRARERDGADGELGYGEDEPDSDEDFEVHTRT